MRKRQSKGPRVRLKQLKKRIGRRVKTEKTWKEESRRREVRVKERWKEYSM